MHPKYLNGTNVIRYTLNITVQWAAAVAWQSLKKKMKFLCILPTRISIALKYKNFSCSKHQVNLLLSRIMSHVNNIGCHGSDG